MPLQGRLICPAKSGNERDCECPGATVKQKCRAHNVQKYQHKQNTRDRHREYEKKRRIQQRAEEKSDLTTLHARRERDTMRDKKRRQSSKDLGLLARAPKHEKYCARARQRAAATSQNPSLTRQAASVDEPSMAAPLASGASDHVVATSAPPLATQSTLALALPAIPSPLTMPPTLALPEHVPQQQRSESSTRAIADTHDDAQATEADTTGATCECLPRDPTKWRSFNNAQSVQVWQCDDCGEQWEW